MPQSTAQFLIFLIAVLGGCSVSLACSCRKSIPPCGGLQENDVVFTGTARSFVRGDSGRVATFDVIETFAGTTSRSARVRTGAGGGDCGFDFKVGKTYLVDGALYEGKIGTGICSRTREVEYASEDIAILRELKANDRIASRIFGNAGRLSKLGQYDYSVSPIIRAKVFATRPDGVEFVTSTDLNGNYTFRNLHAGTYAVRMLSDPNFVKTATVILGASRQDQCREQNFVIKSGARITGRVVDEKGDPVARIRVIAAYYQRPDDEDSWSWFEGYSDESGRFEIEGPIPGTYTLGVNFDGPTRMDFPFPPTFFPNVSDPKLARRFSINDVKSYDGFDLAMTSRLVPRTIFGTVVFPNGKPAVGAKVSLKEAKTTWIMDRADVDVNGGFSVAAFDGIAYTLYVYNDFESWGMNRESRKIAIPLNGGVEPFKLTVPFPSSK